jgi:hypothetical protein
LNTSSSSVTHGDNKNLRVDSGVGTGTSDCDKSGISVKMPLSSKSTLPGFNPVDEIVLREFTSKHSEDEDDGFKDEVRLTKFEEEDNNDVKHLFSADIQDCPKLGMLLDQGFGDLDVRQA